MEKKTRLFLVWTLAVFLGIVLLSLPAHAADKYWTGGGGNWATNSKWSPSGVPVTGDNAYLDRSTGSFDWDIVYNDTSSAVLNDMRIDATSTGTISLSLGSGYSLEAGNREYIGYSGTGSVNQTDGTNSITNLIVLGWNSGSGGAYNLSNGALLTKHETIGASGTATFTQTGGTHTLSGSEGVFSVGGNSSGVGTFNLSGGTFSTYDAWSGRVVGGTGTYNLSGTGNFSAYKETIGNAGTGIFNQTGGTHTVTNLFRIGGNASGDTAADGYYNLSGGSLSTWHQTIGTYGTATFTQTGGTNTLSGTNATLNIGAFSGGTGIYNLSDGELSTVRTWVGWQGAGTFTQSGGTHTVTDAEGLTIAKATGSGTYNFSGGSIIADITNNDVMNISGAGTKTIDGTLTSASTGYLQGNGANFYITGDFKNQSTQNALWDTYSAFLGFIGTSASHNLDLAGVDYGADPGGYTNNFAWGTLSVASGNILTLYDGNAVSGGALYVDGILGVDTTGTQVNNIYDWNGLNVYYKVNDPDNAYLGGQTYDLAGTGGGQLIPTVLPEPISSILFLSGGATLGFRRYWRKRGQKA